MSDTFNTNAIAFRAAGTGIVVRPFDTESERETYPMHGIPYVVKDPVGTICTARGDTFKAVSSTLREVPFEASSDAYMSKLDDEIVDIMVSTPNWAILLVLLDGLKSPAVNCTVCKNLCRNSGTDDEQHTRAFWTKTGHVVCSDCISQFWLMQHIDRPFDLPHTIAEDSTGDWPSDRTTIVWLESAPTPVDLDEAKKFMRNAEHPEAEQLRDAMNSCFEDGEPFLYNSVDSTVIKTEQT